MADKTPEIPLCAAGVDGMTREKTKVSCIKWVMHHLSDR